MAEDVFGFDVVEVYVEEGVFEKSKKKLNDFKGDEVVVIDGVEVELVVEGEDEGEVQVEAEVQLDEEGFVEVEVQGEDEAGVVGEMEVVVEGVDVDDVGAEADDDDVRAKETDDDDVGADEDDNDSNNCSEVSDSDFEESSDWTAWLDFETFSQSTDPTFDTNKVDSINCDFADEGGYSDELDTPPRSEDEGPQKVRFPRFKVPKNDEDVKFEVGLQFSSKKQILEAIKTFAVISKKNLKIKKNDKKRVIAICKQKGYPFYLRVSKSIQATYWKVVTFKEDHCCFRTATNSWTTPEWVAKKVDVIINA